MGATAAWVALGLTTLIQLIAAVDGWRQRRERQEVHAEATDDQLDDRLARVERDLVDLRDLRRELVRVDDLMRVEGRMERIETRVDAIFIALRRNGHAT